MAELSNFLGYAIGILLSYFLNKKYNFKSNNSHVKDFPRFAISMFTAYIVNLIILMVIFRYYELSFYLAQVLAGVGYVLVGYILSKYYVFIEK